MKETDGLDPLVERAWDLFGETSDAGDDVVVRPSVPILFFGSSGAYRESPLKIITVGLNPSKFEFDGPDPFHRFPKARDARKGGSMADYVAALDAYFETDPYRLWFSSYEPLLNGLGASYYPGTPGSFALHTDICSPVATSPTWARLDRRIQTALWDDGRQLWHDLIRALAPDVILASVRKEYAAGIDFEATAPRVAITIERTNPYVVTTRTVTIAPDKKTLLVTGKAAQTPFGTVSKDDKRTIGSALREQLDA